MAFRTAAHLKSMTNALRGTSNFTTSTPPKMAATAASASDQSLPSAQSLKSKFPKGEYFPVMVAVGMIALSGGFGLFTVWHQLGRAPNVSLKKSRRETIPEVVEPERVAASSEKFIKQSFFRKIAHIQDFDRQDVMRDPIRGDVLTRPVRVETLKDVGVDPMPH